MDNLRRPDSGVDDTGPLDFGLVAGSLWDVKAICEFFTRFLLEVVNVRDVLKTCGMRRDGLVKGRGAIENSHSLQASFRPRGKCLDMFTQNDVPFF